MDLSSLPPFNKNYRYFVNNKDNSLMKYSNSSDAIVRSGNNIGVFIPGIGNMYRKLDSNEHKEILEELTHDLIDISIEQDTFLVKFNIIKNNFFIGEPIRINLDYSSMINPLVINNFLEINATKDSINSKLYVDYDHSNESYYCIFEPQIGGLWYFEGSLQYDDPILLDPISVIVQDYD